MSGLCNDATCISAASKDGGDPMRSTASIARKPTPVSTQVEGANPARDWGDGRYARPGRQAHRRSSRRAPAQPRGSGDQQAPRTPIGPCSARASMGRERRSFPCCDGRAMRLPKPHLVGSPVPGKGGRSSRGRSPRKPSWLRAGGMRRCVELSWRALAR
jgi:hypothetical protein